MVFCCIFAPTRPTRLKSESNIKEKSLINYNIETIPLSLLISFANQRKLIPFPTSIEAIIMIIIGSILRESDIRFPSSYGSSVSIVGALILGSAAVEAGLISPIMIIIILR